MQILNSLDFFTRDNFCNHTRDTNLLRNRVCRFLVIARQHNNFQAERLSLAIMATMTAQLALEQCLAYVKERTTFGKPLSKHQVIRHKLAEMATQVDVAREYAYRCAARMQAGESAIAEVSMAKNFATSVSTMVTDEAVQIFGGMGFMRESLVERLYRDNRILSIGGGTHEIMNEIIAKQLGL